MEDHSTGYTDSGYFIFSFDTELAWGRFDSNTRRSKKYSPNGSRERDSICQLLDIFNEFGIIATWAVVGHLFYEHCEMCMICPILGWKNIYDSFYDIYESNNRLWYAADIIDLLIRKGIGHEIAFHGYTHQLFNEKTMSESEATIEIEEWLRVAKEKQVVPQAVAFPRNKVGYLELFYKYGFICYRGWMDKPSYYSIPIIGRVMSKLNDYISPLFPPQVYQIDKIEPSGLVNVPSTQYFFGNYRRFEKLLDSLNLHLLSSHRIIQSVKKATNEKKILHVRAHPCEFQQKKDFEKLRYLLSYVAEEMAEGGIKSVGMSQLAKMIINQKS